MELCDEVTRKRVHVGFIYRNESTSVVRPRMTGRGKRISTQTVGRVGIDVWVLICSHLQFSPHVVFRIMAACKGVRVQLGENNKDWWNMFYDKVMTYQSGLRHSNYQKGLARVGRVFGGERKQKLLKAVFSRQCCFCASRFKHRLLPFLGIRACPTPCLRDNMISNISLYFRYGVSFSDQPPARMLVHHVPKPLNQLAKITVDPYDHGYLMGRVNFLGLVCFFLRQDVVGWIPPGAEELQYQKRLAAQFITARIARLGTRSSSIMDNVIREQRYRQSVRRAQPFLPHHYWVPGGAYTAEGNRRDGFDLVQAVALKNKIETTWRKQGRA